MSYGEDAAECQSFRLLRILQTHNKAVPAAIKANLQPRLTPVTPVPFWLTSFLSMHSQIHTQTPSRLITLATLMILGLGKITEHICCSSILIMNWMVANCHYRLSFQSICTPLPFIPRHFLYLTHGVIYTFMTLKHKPVYREGLLPCLQSKSLQSSLLKGHFRSTSAKGYFPMVGASEVSYRNNSEGRSQEQRERGVYRVSAHGKLEDYLWICSRTGGAGRDRRLVREIRGVPAVQRQAALKQGHDDNWK